MVHLQPTDTCDHVTLKNQSLLDREALKTGCYWIPNKYVSPLDYLQKVCKTRHILEINPTGLLKNKIPFKLYSIS